MTKKQKIKPIRYKLEDWLERREEEGNFPLAYIPPGKRLVVMNRRETEDKHQS